MRQQLSVPPEQKKKLRTRDIRFIVDHTFPNAEDDLREKLRFRMSIWGESRLRPLYSLITQGKVDVARQAILDWI